MRSRAMSLTRVLVRSFSRFHAPEPSLLTFGGTPSFAAVFGQLVERVDADEDYVVVTVEELYHLLRAAVHVGAHQPGEPAHPWSMWTM